MKTTIEIPWNRYTECLERMCEDYCTWPKDATSDETLKLHCQECPLNNFHIDEYWEKKND